MVLVILFLTIVFIIFASQVEKGQSENLNETTFMRESRENQRALRYGGTIRITKGESLNIGSIPSRTRVVGLGIDVYTDRGGIGPGRAYPFGWSDAYGPKEEIYAYAKVTFNHELVKYKLVTFEMIDPHGESRDYRKAITDTDGIATARFKISWEDLNAEALFGNWSITGAVDIASLIVATDTVYFRFGYIISIRGITVNPESLHKGETMTIYIEVQSISMTGKDVFLTIVACDELNVPIDIAFASTTVNPEDSITIDYTVTIPSWAFVGSGTIYVDAFDKAPSLGGIPYCPERTATFTILKTP